jgi:hypothetical protein
MPHRNTDPLRFLPLSDFLKGLAEELESKVPVAAQILDILDARMPCPTGADPTLPNLLQGDIIGLTRYATRWEGTRIIVEGVLDMLPGYEPQITTPGYPFFSFVVTKLGTIRLEIRPDEFWFAISGPSVALRFDPALLRPANTGSHSRFAEIELANLGFLAADSRGNISLITGPDKQLGFTTHNYPWLIGDTGISIEVPDVLINFDEGEAGGLAIVVKEGSVILPESVGSLSVQQTCLTRSGAFSIDAHGTLNLPFGQIAVPEHQPLHIDFHPQSGMQLAGGAQLSLNSGITLESNLVIQDPDYYFSLAVHGMRLELTRQVAGQLPALPTHPEVSRDAIRTLNACFQSTNSSLATLVSTSTGPVGWPPEFEAWAPVLSMDPLAAWATSILAGLQIDGKHNYDSSYPTVRNMLQALANDTRQARRFPLDEKNEEKRVATLKRVAQAINAIAEAAVEPPFDRDSPELTEALDETRKNIQALFEGNVSTKTVAQARLVTRAALDFDAAENLLGITSPAEFTTQLPDFLKEAREIQAERLGLDATDGSVKDEGLFNALTRTELKQAMKDLMNLEATASDVGDHDPVGPAIMQALGERRQQGIEEDLAGLPNGDHYQRFLLVEELQEIIQATGPEDLKETAIRELEKAIQDAGTYERLEDVFEPSETDPSIDLAAYSSIQDESLEDIFELSENFWNWLAERPLDITSQQTLNREIEHHITRLREWLEDDMDPLGEGIDVLTGVIKLLKWVEKQRQSDSGQANLLDEGLPTLITELTSRFTQAAEEQNAWWSLGQYAEATLTAAIEHAGSGTQPLTTALEAAAMSAVWSAEAIANSLAGELPESVPAAMQLPGDLEISHIYGAAGYNRVTEAFNLRFQGRMKFPGTDQHMAVNGGLETGDVFWLSTTGQLHLGNGVWLFPVDNQPILELRGQPSNTYKFAVNALFLAPHAESDTHTRAIQVGGELELRTGTDDRLGLYRFRAASSATGLDWELPGGIVIQDAAVCLDYDKERKRFAAGIGGRLKLGDQAGQASLQAELTFNNLDDPTDIGIDTTIQVSGLNLFDQAYLFDSELHLQVQTQPPSGTLAVRGTAGLFPGESYASPPADIQDFDLSVSNLDGSFSFSPDGFELRLKAGQLGLPEIFGPDPESTAGKQPAVSLSDSRPLLLQYVAVDKALRFGGQLTFSNFGVNLPGTGPAGALMIRLETATLTLAGTSRPQLTQVAGLIRLPLNQDKPVEVRFEDCDWDLTGLPTGRIGLGNNIDIPLGGGLELAILGDGRGGSTGSGLSVMHKAGGDYQFRIEGAIKLTIPADMLTSHQGSQLFSKASGSLEIRPGDWPAMAIEEFELEWPDQVHSLRLGGSQGIEIKQAGIKAEGIENLFNFSFR